MDSGMNLADSLASYDLDTSSWRTSQGCLFEAWMPYLEPFVTSGMMRNGELYPQPTWEPRTLESGSGLWATPGASMGGTRQPDGKRGARLQEQVERPDIWPTPTSTDAKNSRRHGYMVKGHAGTTLLDAGGENPHQAQYPTPSATTYGSSGNGDGGNKASRGRPSLETMAKKDLWPTPVAGDSHIAGPNQNTSTLGRQMRREEGSGQLNPTWVEWLMGYPQHWTLVE